MVDKQLKKLYRRLPCCFSYLKRQKLILSKQDWNNMKIFDSKRLSFVPIINDGIHLDSIINLKNLNISPKSIIKEMNNNKDGESNKSDKTCDINLFVDSYLYLYSDIIVTKGVTESLLCDLTRKSLYPVPNSFVNFLAILKEKTVGDIIRLFDQNIGSNIVISYFEFLLTNDMVFPVANKDNFESSIKYKERLWETLNSSYNQIDAVIIDINRESMFNIVRLFKQIANLGYTKLLLRFTCENDFVFLNILTEIESQFTLNRIDIYLPYGMYIRFKQKIIDNPRIFNVLVYDSPSSVVKIERFKVHNLRKFLFFTEKKTLTPNDCGNISFGSTAMIRSTKFVLRNLYVNSCLYKKIAISENGMVKNCPSMNFDFGYVDDVELENVVNDPDFQRVWFVNKDKINICCQCQYRYLCFDCRAYTIGNDYYGKPSKCTFSPQKNIWK